MVSVEGDFAPRFNELARFNICKLVHDTSSLISGSICLSMIFPEKVHSSDIDVYTPVHYLPRMTASLIQLGYTLRQTDSASEYNKSGFFRKNKIYSRLLFTMKNRIHLDVVCTNTDPLTVVNNFDLTVCQVWFDGEKMSASHAETLEMRGILNRSYLNLLGKKCLTDRIIKYTRRGFTTTFPGLESVDEEFKEDEPETRDFEELLAFFIVREYFDDRKDGFATSLADPNMRSVTAFLGINCKNIRMKRRELLYFCLNQYHRRKLPGKNMHVLIRKCISKVTSDCSDPNCLSKAYHAPQDDREVSASQQILEREVKVLKDPAVVALLAPEYK